MMRTAILLIGLPGWLGAQESSPAPRGAYRFVHLTFSDGEKLEAASRGGTLTFQEPDTVRWGDAAANYEITGPHEAVLKAAAAKLTLRFNHDASLLVGSAAGESGSRHHLFVAVKAAEGVSPLAFRGNYAVASLAIRNGATTGFATSFSQMTASGMGQFTKAVVAGHAAGVDDVNRREERSGLTYEFASDGTGIAHLGTGSDVLNGDMRVAISQDGGILLGWSADAANPAILLGLRKTEVATFSFRGRFWLAELLAENSFVFQKSTRLSSASGSLSSNSNGLTYVSQQVLSNGETSYLATTNQYRVSSDGTNSLLPRLEGGVDNFAFGESAFIGAQVGATGQLSLNHGIVFGIPAPPMLPVLTSAAAPLTPDAPVAPGSLMSLSGMFPQGAKVRINGADAELGSAAPDRIQFRVPETIEGGALVTIELVAADKVLQSFRAHRTASSPALFTADGNGVGVAAAAHEDGSTIALMKPAEPGETVTLTGTGLGSAPTLRVLFDGQPGEVKSTAPVEGQPGRYQIKVVVPRDLNVAVGSTREVAVALATPDSFNDLADLLVTRKPAPGE